MNVNGFFPEVHCLYFAYFIILYIRVSPVSEKRIDLSSLPLVPVYEGEVFTIPLVSVVLIMQTKRFVT